MATLYVNNQPYSFEGEHRNLLDVCLSLGFDLPYFCWHPAMHSVGACRQCAVKQFKDEKDDKGKIVMACMTPAKDGTRISIDDPEAREFRARIIEWLMVNHPHDCPVCDEGGECHLQDMTVMTGHVYRRYRFSKRTHRNQYLGPFINHEMNRCIQCYRCVRFYREYAGGRDFDVFGWHDHVYFGRHDDGVLESPFAGNLVEVCPTGVFTDKTLEQHFTRKWDLQTAPSVCIHCGLGCNTIPGERYGGLRRIRNRYNHQVNGYFLCDRGRYGYEFVNSDQRIRQPLVRGEEGSLHFADPDDAVEHASHLLETDTVIGIGSPRASLESNAALRSLVGQDTFCHGMTNDEARLVTAIQTILRNGPAPAASLRDVDQSDSVLVLGEDVTNVAPMLGLALRQAILSKPIAEAMKRKVPGWMDAAIREAIQSEKGPFFVLTPDSTVLDEIATVAHRAAPDDIARLGFAVAHAIDPKAPDVPNLAAPLRSLAQRIANALQQGDRPLVVAGTSCGSESVIQAAANIAAALKRKDKDARLCFTVPECNSMGVAMLGGKSLEQAAEQVAQARSDGEKTVTVIVLERDILRQADAKTAETLLNTGHLIVLDHLHSATTDRAAVVLPAATFAEADGTLVNNETRAQRFYQVYAPEGAIRQSWQWLAAFTTATGQSESATWTTLDDITKAIAEDMPALAGIETIAPPAGFRIVNQKIPREPHRYSGRTAMYAHTTVHEPPPPDDADTPLAFSMEGFEGQPPAPLIARFWSPGWNSVQSVNKFQQEIAGPLRDDNPGCRLIEPPANDSARYFDQIPQAFERRADEWLILQACHVFGSDELSNHAPAIAELVPKPCLTINTSDAEQLGLANDQAVDVTVANTTHRVSTKLKAELPRGIAMLSTGLPGLEGLVLPGWGRLALAEETPGEQEGAS